MHIDFRHLRTIRAIHQAGGLARAAELLNITQSALSHQIKGLEDQAGVELFVRRSRRLRLSAAGHAPVARGRKGPARDRGAGGRVRRAQAGQRRAAAHRHRVPCLFRMAVPGAGGIPQVLGDVDVDIRPGLAFDALPALQKEEVDLVISSDPEDLPASRSSHCSTTSRFSSPRPAPAGGKALYRGRGPARRDADHLSGGPHAA